MKDHYLVFGGIALLVYLEWKRRHRGSVQPAGNVSSMAALQTISPVDLTTRGFGYPTGRPSNAYIQPAYCTPSATR